MLVLTGIIWTASDVYLEDVGLSVRDQYQEEFVEGLVHVANIVLLASCVLRVAIGELGEGSKKSFDARALHFAELAREHGFASASAYRSRKDNLYY